MKSYPTIRQSASLLVFLLQFIIINEIFQKNFKPKVKPMIASIIEKYPKKDDKYKAAALMSALSEIHTRFARKRE